MKKTQPGQDRRSDCLANSSSGVGKELASSGWVLTAARGAARCRAGLGMSALGGHAPLGAFQRSSITVKPRRAAPLGPLPIGEGERARWTFSTDRFTFGLQAWFVPNETQVSPPPVEAEPEPEQDAAADEGSPRAAQVPPPPVITVGEEAERTTIFPERVVGNEEEDDAGGKSMGAFIAPTSGAIHFRLNNEFSRLRPKKVNYELDVQMIPNGEVTVELEDVAPSLKESAGFSANDRLQVISTDDLGLCAEAGVAPTMVLSAMNGEELDQASWAHLEAHILAKSKDGVDLPWKFTFRVPVEGDGPGTPPRDADSPSLAMLEGPSPEQERRDAEVKELALRFKEETDAEAALESGEQMPPPPGGNRVQTTMDVRPWKDRIHDATLAVQGQQLVMDSGRQYKRACDEYRRSVNEPQGFLGRAFGAGARASGRGANQQNMEATGQAAQQLRQAAEKLSQAGQYELAGAALQTKSELHERQQLPDAQVAALLAAAEQYRRGVGGGLGTGQGIRQELVAEAMRAYDTARDVRLLQAETGTARPLQQAADVQQLIVGTYKQAKKWEEAAIAQLLLNDLRNGRIPTREVPAGEADEGEESVGGAESPTGGGAPSPRAGSFRAFLGDAAAKLGGEAK